MAKAKKTKSKATTKSAKATSSKAAKKSPRKRSNSKTTPLVAILTGSPSDLGVVTKAQDTLNDLGIPSDIRVLSAHRTPTDTIAYVNAAEELGVEVFICCAGMAAHLAGVVAGHTLRPVIGLPLASGALAGMDALLATVQMPPGVPVATVGVDNARNAAFLAARIVGNQRPEVRDALAHALERSRARYDSPDPSVPGQASALRGRG